MPLPSLCPGPQALQQLLLGNSAAAEAQMLGEHVLHCDHCAQTLHQLNADDTLVEALRAGAAAAADDPESEVIQGLIQRLQGMRSCCAATPDFSTEAPSVVSSDEATVPPNAAAVARRTAEDTLSLHTGSGASSAGEATEVVFDFLAPPQGPGELGRLGPYRVLKVLGAGGMGVVFQAEDTHLERMVALKAMLPALASSPSARQRFLREARAVAAIEHDHIVAIFQVGEDRGVPYLAMPLLKGEPLDQRLKRENKLPLITALRIAREIAEGLAAAHERGLIHRDIKPGNIWLEGKRDRVKILDFGLARAVADTAQLTQSGALVGTPAYMALEQARGGSVDHRADLFSLGCVLYRLITGELPFKGADTMSILTSLALDAPRPPRELNPKVPSALSDLVMQLLAKNPADRPQSAQIVIARIKTLEQDLAEGTDEPNGVTAASPVSSSPRGQAGKRPDSSRTMSVDILDPLSSAQPRTQASGRRLVRMAIVVGLGVLGVSGYRFAPTIFRIATNQGELVIKTDDPDVEVRVKQGGELVQIVDAKTGHEINLKAGRYHLELIQGKNGLQLSTNDFTLERGGRQIVKVQLNPAAADLPPAGGKPPVAVPPLLSQVVEVRRFERHAGRVAALAFSADGKTLASGSDDKTVKLWDTASGKERATLQTHATSLCSVAFSKDGKLLASGDFQGTVVLWDVEAAKERLVIDADRHSAWAVPFLPDGKTLVTGGGLNVRFWDVKTGKEQFSLLQPVAVRSLALSPDGKAVAVTHFRGGAQLWDVAGRKVRYVFGNNGHDLNSVAFSADGKVMATGGTDRTVRLWNVDTGGLLLAFAPLQQTIESLALSPDGKFLVTGGGDWRKPILPGEISVWEVATGKERASLKAVGGVVSAVAFAPDGNTFATASYDGIVRLFQSPDLPFPKAAGEKGRFEGHTGPVNGVALSGDGRRAVTSSRDGTVRLWDVDAGKEIRQFDSGPAVSVAFSPDGRRILAGTLDLHKFGGALLWDADSGKELRRFRMGASWPNSVAFSGDGRRVLTAGMWSTFVLWDVDTGKQIRSFANPGKIVTSVAISQDGRLALSGSDRETVFRLWDVEKGTVQKVFKGHGATIKSVAFSPDGRRALSGSEDETLRLWDVGTGQELQRYQGHTDSVNSVAFTPDGMRALSGGSDQTVRLWDVSTGKEARCFTGHTGTVLCVAVAADGRRAISGGEDKKLRLWELPPAGQVQQFDGNTEPVWMVRFAREGRQVLSVSKDTVRQWDSGSGTSTAAPWALAHFPSLAAFSPDGGNIVFNYGARAIYSWRVKPRTLLPELVAYGASLTCAGYSGDGKRLIGGNQRLNDEPAAVQVWHVVTGKQIALMKGHKESIRSAALSRDGRLALSSGPDGVRLWDVDKGESLRSLDRQAVVGLAFSPDGGRALLGDGSGALVVWDLGTGKESLTCTGHKGAVNSVAFSPDGLRAVSGGEDQTVRLWNAGTGKELACFRGHTAQVSSVAFSPDGHDALSGSADKTVRLWALPIAGLQR